LHAHQFRRVTRELRFLRARLIRYVHRQIQDDARLQGRFGPLPALAARNRQQTQRQFVPKVYLRHAPELAYIGKGKARDTV
jgi:hypothetical protein